MAAKMQGHRLSVVPGATLAFLGGDDEQKRLELRARILSLEASRNAAAHGISRSEVGA
ncbi:MAG: hypothetical protein Q9228_007925, partial [Teloschistes exilis]